MILPTESDSSVINNVPVLRRTFDTLSKEGVLKMTDFKKLLKLSGENFTDVEIKDSLNKLNLSTNNTLTYEEVESVVNLCKDPKTIIDAFIVFDKEKKGYVSVDEFKGILKLVQTDLSDKDINELLDTFGGVTDGKINYTEFVKFWNEA